MLYRSANTPSVFSLRNEIDRLFEDTFGTDGQRRAWLPAVDVQETGDAFTFELELPGVDPEQVDVTADNGVLTVRGEKARQSRKEGDEGRYHVVERSYGSFVRAFQLPQGAEEEQITAGFRNGVLMVRVPKAQRPQPRKIRVDAGSAAGGAERPAIQTGATTRESSESRSKAKAGATS
jgi:HSP20 family protein